MGMQYREAVLANGLRIIAEVCPEASTVAAGFFVRAGARDEDPGKMGTSHFLEHMVFKGSEHRAAADVDREFDERGAVHNAYTTSEMTVFWAHFLPEHAQDCIEILADIMRPSLRQEDFDAEKSVILEEIAMYEDEPFSVLVDMVMERCYLRHPAGHRILGTEATVSAMMRDDLGDYLGTHYSADNIVLALAGQVDFDAMVTWIGQTCGHWKKGAPVRSCPVPPWPKTTFSLERESVTQHYLAALSPAPHCADKDRYASQVLAQVLGGGDGSRLHWALLETGLAEDVGVHYEGREAAGHYLLYACCDPGDAHQVEAVIMEQVAALPASLDEEDLQRVTRRVATAAALHGERPSGQMQRIGQQRLAMGEYRSLEDEIAHFTGLTIRDLQRACERYPITPRVTGRLCPAAGQRGG